MMKSTSKNGHEVSNRAIERMIHETTGGHATVRGEDKVLIRTLDRNVAICIGLVFNKNNAHITDTADVERPLYGFWIPRNKIVANFS